MSQAVEPIQLTSAHQDFLVSQLGIEGVPSAEEDERSRLNESIYENILAVVKSQGYVLSEYAAGESEENVLTQKRLQTNPLPTTLPDLSLEFEAHGSFEGDKPRELKLSMRGVVRMVGFTATQRVCDVSGQHMYGELSVGNVRNAANSSEGEHQWSISDLRTIESLVAAVRLSTGSPGQTP